eukprot:83911_1
MFTLFAFGALLLQPLSATSVGRQYKVGPELIWREANQFCIDKYGATLATITSKEDRLNAQATLQASKIDDHGAFIGLNDRKTSGKWTWIDGTDCSYAPNGDCINDPFWKYNEPNSKHERCVVFHIELALYNDYLCGNPRATLCNSPN